MQDTPSTLTRSFTGYSLGVVMSRVSGMFRDIALAAFFGVSAEIALFMVAYRFANLMRRMLAETPLASSFVPLFEKTKRESKEQSAGFFRDTFFSLAVIASVVTLMIVGGLQVALQTIPSQTRLIELTQIMTPSLLAICLYALCSQLLHCERKFFLPAVAPVGFNLMWIIAAYLGSRYVSFASMHLLAWGVVVAFVVQWLILLPTTLKVLPGALSWGFLKKTKLFSPSVRLMGRPFLLGALGMGAAQINMALDSLFATAADLQGPAFLWYAVRIEQVPMALFGVAISATLLPALARAVKSGALEHAAALLQQGLKRSFALMAFSMFGLLALGRLVVMILFARGAFDLVALEATTKCLWYYSLGLIPHGAVLLLAAAFYAYEDFKTPMRASIYAVILNVASNAFMVFVLHLGAPSIALATSLTSLFNYLYLQKQLKKKNIQKLVPSIFYIKTLITGALTLALTLGLQSFVFKTLKLGSSSLVALGSLILLGSFYVSVYFLLEIKLKCKEIFSLFKEVIGLRKN